MQPMEKNVEKQLVVRTFEPDMNALKQTAKQLAHMQDTSLNLYGQAGEVLRQTAGVPQASLCVQPDFDREGATLGVHGIVCFRIAEIIGTILQEKRQNHASD